MIFGEYVLGNIKLKLEKRKNFEKFFSSTGIKTVYKSNIK